MEIISFDVCGKMAHFRKYYANNTALSFSIPPRTTIIGMLASMIGYSKDEYYEAFSSEYLRIGIRCVSSIKKTFHRMNIPKYGSIPNFKTIEDVETKTFLEYKENRALLPFEIVTGQDLRFDNVVYRIFLAQGVEDNGEYDKLKAVLLEGKSHFNLSLGTANFGAWVENVQVYNDCQFSQSTDSIGFHSAVLSDEIIALDTDKIGDNFIEEELLPADFVANFDRELSKMNRVLFSTRGLPVYVETNKGYYIVEDDRNGIQNIMFLE